MNLVNEQVRHGLYGKGTVVNQEEDVLFVQFSELYGIKKFLFPDAFEKFLKLYDPEIEISVTKELYEKKVRIKADELRKQQEYEETAGVLAKSKLDALKKKSSRKSKTAMQKNRNDFNASEKYEEDKEE